MRRIGRYILNTLTVLSLVLCGATAILWARSYYRGYELQWNNEVRERTPRLVSWDGAVSRGCFRFGLFRVRLSDPSNRGARVGGGWILDSSKPTDLDGNVIVTPSVVMRTVPGVTCLTEDDDWGGTSLQMFLVRAWMMAMIAAALPFCYAITWIRRRGSRREGVCRTCNYDLRATPDRCPEMFSLL